VKFWDASAVVPLLLREPARDQLFQILERDPVLLVWWATPVECTSAVSRRERDGSVTAADATAALARLRSLKAAWHEVLPSSPLRDLSERLLRVHPLRAADSLQLAAALVAAEREPETLEFVGLDEQLNEAASREGFSVMTA